MILLKSKAFPHSITTSVSNVACVTIDGDFGLNVGFTDHLYTYTTRNYK
jgi:hypothetical protein